MKKKLPLTIMAFLLVAGALCWIFFKPSRKPNVILLTVDGIRSKHLQINGYARNTTPALTKFSQNSIYFRNYFSTSILTPVSEASVHTGKYPLDNKMIDFNHLVTEKTPMLAEILKKQGYQTFAFGNAPEFQKSAPAESFPRGFDNFEMVRWSRYSGKSWLDFPSIFDKIAESDQPFFLWIPVSNAHAPYLNFKEFNFYDETYRGVFSRYEFSVNAHFYLNSYVYPKTEENKIAWFRPEIGKVEKNYNKYVPDHFSKDFSKKPVKVSKEDIQQVLNLYDESLMSADLQIELVLTELKKRGLYDKTVIIIETPRGEEIDEHGYIGHYDLYEPTVQTTLFFKPEKEIDGQVSDRFVSAVDILPSLLKYLNIESGIEDLPGKNDLFDMQLKNNTEESVFIMRLPLWEINLTAAKSDLFEKLRSENSPVPHFDTAIRTKKWKVIHRRSRFAVQKYSVFHFAAGLKASAAAEFEVFNMLNDPLEQNPLAQPDEEEVTNLKKKLLKWENDSVNRYEEGQVAKKKQDL